jgi:outer membrane protein OmpA-like peptidoglycan-associated protein
MISYKKIVWSCIGVFFSFISLAQIQSTKLRIADVLIADGKNYEAIDVLEEAAAQESNAQIALQLAKLYQKINYLPKAEYWFKKYMDYDLPEAMNYMVEYAMVLKSQEKYAQANEVLQNYLKAYKALDKNMVMKKINAEIENNTYVLALSTHPQTFVVKDNTKNFTYNDLAPVWHKDTLFFTGIATDTVVNFLDVNDSLPKFQIYYWQEQNGITVAIPFLPEIIQEQSYHTGNLAFSNDGKRMYFTRCKENLDAQMICTIYGSKQNEKGQWQKAQRLTGGVNNENNDWSSTHPTLFFEDKKKVDILYFASNKPGGLGDYDLYTCMVNANFVSDIPKNLGNKINTVRKEITPFYDVENQYLYFSSDGLGGLGGLDIFKAKDKGRGRLDKSENLLLPINSGSDDLYYFYVNDSLSFLSSNRLGAKSYYKGHRLEDIFKVKTIQDKYIKFLIYNTKDSIKPLQDVQILIQHKMENELEKKEYQSILSSEIYKIYPKNSYFIVAQKNNYLSKYQNFKWDLNSNKDTVDLVLYLDSIVYGAEQKWEDIYFETNSATLQKQSFVSLQKLLDFLFYNPNIIIEINAHTDNVGSAESNEVLSLQRAQTVADYLIVKGIGKNRLLVKGFGAEFPFADNVTEEGRALNRRVNIKIVSNLSNIVNGVSNE